MLTPTFANHVSFLYATGNTPATSLTRNVPHGQDANILSLGCGDVRNILYTAYVEKGLPKRRIDVTTCDIDDKVIARNVIWATLLIYNDDKVSNDSLWDIYYHPLIDTPATEVLLRHVNRLLPSLASLEEWDSSSYSRTFKFCDADTLDDVRRRCNDIAVAAEHIHDAHMKTKLEANLYASKQRRQEMTGGGNVFSGARSAAPLAMSAIKEAPKINTHYWDNGTVMPNNGKADLPNPMFASLVTQNDLVHYGSDPTMGFHLATAFAPLLDSSPLKPKGSTSNFKTVRAAKTEFAEWVAAFREAVKHHLVVRFAVADVFAFCHTLQHAAASKETSANWYRRQWDTMPLNLDEASYGSDGTGPTSFDIVDTSNLSDHVGALNILLSTAPLLEEQPWATISTDLLIRARGSQNDAFNSLLCGHAATVSLFLGVSPVQYWTNARVESHLDEMTLGYVGSSMTKDEATQLHSRLAWKRDDQFSGQTQGRGKLHMKATEVVEILLEMYRQMFLGETIQTESADMFAAKVTYGHFHRGTFAALLKTVMNRVETNWKEVFRILIDKIDTNPTVALSSNYMHELGIQLHLQSIITESWILEIKPQVDDGPLKGWKSIPPAVAVTVAIPRSALDPLYTGSDRQKAAPGFTGSLRSSPAAPDQWHSLFADVQIAFGKMSTVYTEEGYSVTVKGDSEGWAGSSPLIASFVVPTAALQVEPATALVEICVPPGGQNTLLYAPILGLTMTVFQTSLADTSSVIVSRLMPGQIGHRITSGGVQPLPDSSAPYSGGLSTKLMADVLPAHSKITTVTGHLDIVSDKGKKLLKDKVPIELRQKSPFVIDIVFGDRRLICPVRFPVPVTTDGSKTRIARTSGYVEVIAPLADFTSASLIDFAFPSSLTPGGLPTALNTPHLNLDRLPAVDVDKKAEMTWLTTVTSMQFSDREKWLRDTKDDSGLTSNARLNFKESLFTMFMITSGLQGTQTGAFAINHPGRGGIHLLVFVSALRLDGDAGAVILDAALIPLTTKHLESNDLKEFFQILQSMQLGTINVDDEELSLWKRSLPSFAERCRTWNHLPTCDYKKRGATIPLSLEFGAKFLCSCGDGKIPDNFVAVPGWESAASHAVRIAISPLFAVPFVEKLIDIGADKKAGAAAKKPERCRSCGKTEAREGGALKTCTRCRLAKYCSAECQKKDWKKHKTGCVEK